MIHIEELSIHLEYKNIKNIYLRINREGVVKLSLPRHYSLSLAQQFLIEKKDWIRKHLKKMPSPSIKDPSMVLIWGQPHRLKINDKASFQIVTIDANVLCIDTINAIGQLGIAQQIQAYKKDLLTAEAQQKIAHWQEIIGVVADVLVVKPLKSKWGVCHIMKKKIVLNLALLDYPKCCLEYVIVHELIHLLEPSHNKRFYALMSFYFPQWKAVKAMLKRGG